MPTSYEYVQPEKLADVNGLEVFVAYEDDDVTQPLSCWVAVKVMSPDGKYDESECDWPQFDLREWPGYPAMSKQWGGPFFPTRAQVKQAIGAALADGWLPEGVREVVEKRHREWASRTH